MKKLKLKVEKSKRINPSTKKMGYAARVKTNGTADYDDIIEDAAEDTTFNVDEIRAAAGIFCRGAAKRLKQGYIVDLGPIGKLYPSCTSGWVEKEEDLKLSDVKPSLYYRPSDDVEGAIKSASLVWAKGGEDDEDEEGGDTPEPTPSGDDAVAAPTISGTTPFETSTSVTMSGPTGAEIRYTTDGSTPTSSSSLYSSALSLSATTTVKAIAIKDGVSSEVTTKTFTKSGGGGGDAD